MATLEDGLGDSDYDESFIDDDDDMSQSSDSYVVTDDDEDGGDEDGTVDDSSSMTQVPSQSSADVANADNEVVELMSEAVNFVGDAAPAEGEEPCGPRRSKRQRSSTVFYEQEHWGATERKLLLQDVTDAEFNDYVQNDNNDPEILTDDEDDDDDDDDDENSC